MRSRGLHLTRLHASTIKLEQYLPIRVAVKMRMYNQRCEEGGKVSTQCQGTGTDMGSNTLPTGLLRTSSCYTPINARPPGSPTLRPPSTRHSLNRPLLFGAKSHLSFLVSEWETLGKSGLCGGGGTSVAILD